jgi:hypothetical protein
MTPEEALKHPWIAELKKKSAKEVRPKHRLRREAETSVEHENTREFHALFALTQRLSFKSNQIFFF